MCYDHFVIASPVVMRLFRRICLQGSLYEAISCYVRMLKAAHATYNHTMPALNLMNIIIVQVTIPYACIASLCSIHVHVYGPIHYLSER